MIGRKIGWIGVAAGMVAVCGSAASAQRLDDVDAAPVGVVDRNNPADLQFDNVKHDFGRISDEGKFEHTFKFTNAGTGTLVISNVKGSCSCTVPALSKSQYAPGESGEIRVIFDPKSKAGHQAQTVTVNSNDADMPLMQLNIAAFVRPEVLVEPRVGHFGEVPKDTSKTIEIVVTGRNPDFTVESVEASDPDNFIIEVGDTVDTRLPIEAPNAHAGHNHGTEIPQAELVNMEYEDVRQCTIKVTMKPGQEIGLIRGKTLTVNHNDSKRPALQVELMAQHKGDLDMIPRRIQLGALEPGQAFREEVTIKSTSGTPFKVTGIEHVAVVSDALDYSFYPADPANPSSYKVIVEGEMPADTRVLRGRLLVRTDMDREQELYVYYYGQARPPVRQETE